MTREEIHELALEPLKDKMGAGINVSMGVGKTYIGLQDMRLHTTDKMFLITAPKKSILLSWKEEISKWGFNELLSRIHFSTYRSLPKKNPGLYSTVYLDECHSLTFSHGHWLTNFRDNHNGRIIGLTGTYPTYLGSEKGKMCNHFVPKVFEYMMDDAIGDGILNDYEIFVHMLLLSSEKDVTKKGKTGVWKTSEWDDYNYWTKIIESTQSPMLAQKYQIMRMKAMQSYPGKLKYAKELFDKQVDKTIVFANFQKQADFLCKDSYHAGNPRSYKNLEKFKSDEINKLSAVEQLSEGANIPGLRCGIILHSYANNRKSSQKIGRLLRLNPEDKATIHILCYYNSVDKFWVKQALKERDQSKIHWIKPA